MLAYSSMRTTCTSALQQNLHQQATWTERDSELVYWRLCLFWNVFISDHSISVSCGRPVSFRIEDVQVELPDVYCSRVSTNYMISPTVQKCFIIYLVTDFE